MPSFAPVVRSLLVDRDSLVEVASAEYDALVDIVEVMIGADEALVGMVTAEAGAVNDVDGSADVILK